MVETKNSSNTDKLEEIRFISFNDLTKAHMIKGKLLDNSIYCYLTNELTNQIAPHYSRLNVGIDLFIRKQDIDNAIKILAENGEQHLLELAGWIFCPHCQSVNVTSQQSPKNGLLTLLKTLFFIPKKHPVAYKCDACGATFEY